jgi:hypothetical protein
VIVVDANVLIYAHNADSPLHTRARAWLEGSLSGKDSIGFSWSTITAFLRIVTNRRALDHPLTIEQAASIVGSWLASPAAVVLVPGPNHWSVLGGLLQSGQATGNLVPDAHLAALAIEHGATLISSDRDFARFPELAFEQLA